MPEDLLEPCDKAQSVSPPGPAELDTCGSAFNQDGPVQRPQRGRQSNVAHSVRATPVTRGMGDSQTREFSQRNKKGNQSSCTFLFPSHRMDCRCKRRPVVPWSRGPVVPWSCGPVVLSSCLAVELRAVAAKDA